MAETLMFDYHRQHGIGMPNVTSFFLLGGGGCSLDRLNSDPVEIILVLSLKYFTFF